MALTLIEEKQIFESFMDVFKRGPYSYRDVCTYLDGGYLPAELHGNANKRADSQAFLKKWKFELVDYNPIPPPSSRMGW